MWGRTVLFSFLFFFLHSCFSFLPSFFFLFLFPLFLFLFLSLLFLFLFLLYFLLHFLFLFFFSFPFPFFFSFLLACFFKPTEQLYYENSVQNLNVNSLYQSWSQCNHDPQNIVQAWEIWHWQPSYHMPSKEWDTSVSLCTLASCCCGWFVYDTSYSTSCCPCVTSHCSQLNQMSCFKFLFFL